MVVVVVVFQQYACFFPFVCSFYIFHIYLSKDRGMVDEVEGSEQQAVVFLVDVYNIYNCIYTSQRGHFDKGDNTSVLTT